MQSGWHLAGLTWRQFLQRVWQQINEDRVTGQSAQLSFYFLLAVFPLLLSLTAVLGLVLQTDSPLHEALRKYLTSVAPGSVSELLDATLQEVTHDSSGGKVSLGLLATLWAASNGMVAIIEALNIVYEVGEARPWWKRRLVGLLLTGTVLGLVFSALILLLYGPRLVDWMGLRFGFGTVLVFLWRVLEWGLVLGFILMAFNLLYIYAPNVKHHRWHWLMPGTAVGVGLWLAASVGFKIYLHYFDRYSVTYGSIGTVIILLLWFYLTGIAILVGAEVNAVLEKASGQRPAPSHPRSLDRRPRWQA